MLVGAGDAGGIIVKEMLGNPELGLVPVAFLDDDPGKRGQQIYGVGVVGGLEDLPRVVAEREVSEVIVAMPRIGYDRPRTVI